MSARTLTARGRRTRERLVAGAADLIHLQGAEATGLDEILAHTGTSKSQLYHYFADKDELVREVIAHQARQVLDAGAATMGEVTSWEGLRAWLDSIAGANEADDCRHGCPVGSLAAELSGDDRARRDLAAAFARWEDEIGVILRRMQDGDELDPDADVEVLATATLAAIQGGLLLSRTARDPAPLRHALDAAYGYLRSFASG